MLMTMLATDAWWTGAQAGWIGAISGSALGLVGAMIGVVGGVLAPRGKGRAFMLCMMGGGLLVCLAILVVGVVAIFLGQPYAVWYPCLLIGVMGIVVLGVLMPVMLNVYRQAERRQLEVRALRGT